MKKKSKITADLKKNRLHIILRGRLSKSDLQEIYTDIRFCVADLKPGFSVITDFSDCQIGYLTGLGTFAKIRDYLHQQEAGIAVRIASKKQLIFHQLSKISTIGKSYPIIYVKTPLEAEEALAEKSATTPLAS